MSKKKKYKYTKKENGLNATGRPTKYDSTIVKKTMDYIASCVDAQIGFTRKVNLPMMCGLCIYLKVNEDTLYEWGKKHPEFSEVLGILKKEQERRLLNNGLSGNYNSAITKLILAKHGYVEKQEVTGKDGTALLVNIISYKQ